MTAAPILLVTHEPLEARLAGPAIRAWHLAHELAKTRPVTLATPAVHDLQPQSPNVQLTVYNRDTGEPLGRLAVGAAAVIASGFSLRRYPVLAQAGRPLAIDLYDPFVLENLEIHAAKPLAEQVALHGGNLAVLMDQLWQGDYFFCASETQRDFWLGMLMAAGRVNPHTLEADPTLRNLIDVVAFGLPDQPPQPRPGVVKGRVPGIGRDDRVVYWGGGIWDWFDPLTLIRAVAAISETRADVKLFFAGVRHPSPDVPPMRMTQAAMDLSDELGLTGRTVFFNDWVPYEQRGAYLVEADVGASLHFAHAETRFSFRTRLLDYLWAGLPMVVTEGDTISEWVRENELGLAVRPGDVDGVRVALLGLLDRPDFRAQAAGRFAVLRERLHWTQVVRPLAAFCDQPCRAADLTEQAQATARSMPMMARAWQVLRERGPAGLLREMRSYFVWQLRRR